MENTVLVVDARSRKISVFTAAATTTATGRLILRKGVDVGSIRMIEGDIEFPVIVMGSYSAQSSAGFVSVLGDDGFPSTLWVGGCGFPGKSGKGEGLRVFPRPVRAVVLPVGSRVSKVDTHSRNSNPATADAALDGIRIMAKNTLASLFLVEGQSDWVTASRFDAPEGGVTPVFPPEHRAEIFLEDNLVLRILLSAARWQLTPEDRDAPRPTDAAIRSRAKELLEGFSSGTGSGSSVEHSLALIDPIEEVIGKVSQSLSPEEDK